MVTSHLKLYIQCFASHCCSYLCCIRYACLKRHSAPHSTPAQTFHPTRRQNILQNAICKYSGLLTPLFVKVRCQKGLSILPYNAMRESLTMGPAVGVLDIGSWFLPPWLLALGCSTIQSAYMKLRGVTLRHTR